MSTSHGGFIYQAVLTGQGATVVTVDTGHSGSYEVSVDVAKEYISNNYFIIYFIINIFYSTRITSSLTIWIRKTEAAINRDEGTTNFHTDMITIFVRP